MEYTLNTPLSLEDISQLKAGDIVYLNGIVLTARDEAHERILKYRKESKKLPFELNGSAIYHCGPLMKKENEKWKVVAAGPTTSVRMNKTTPELLKYFEVRALIGKGGMSEITEHLKGKCVYLAYTGGCAALAADRIKETKDVFWLDLGMPEAVWVFEVQNFGPLIVGSDVEGNDLFRDVMENATKKMKKLF
ncbi:MAG: FumA C-terminus/TtdB family hydratase beta subunit [Candidatus Hydrothermarchaeota archaeon]